MNVSDLRTVCITTGGVTRDPPVEPRRVRAERHFAALGVGPVAFYRGIHGPDIGVNTTLTTSGAARDPALPSEHMHGIGPRPTGIWLSHRTLWGGLLALTPSDDSATLILEDDAQFSADWRTRVDRALGDLPDDWDALFVGACCADDKPKTHHKGEVFEVRWPMCLHAYIVRRKALEVMIARTDAARCYNSIDVVLLLHVWPHLRVYTMRPSACAQWGTNYPA